MPHRITITKASKASKASVEIDQLLASRQTPQANIDGEVAAIIAKVRDEGDQGLLACVRKFDGSEASTIADLAMSKAQLKSAYAGLAKELREALHLAHDRIIAFHQKQLPENQDWEDDTGAQLGMRYLPVDAAGLYTPGGTASYPSSLLMNAAPASVAGVARKVLACPLKTNPQKNYSEAMQVVLATAHIANIDEVWAMGGAHAIAALAYGTETIAAVDVITGPGNAYVATAKRQVFGQVGIDSIAGPTEVVIIADNTQNPDWVAADLLAQAEHDRLAQAILITDDEAFAKQVDTAVEALLPKLSRQAIAKDAWQRHGGLIVVGDWQIAAEIANRLAPEHLHISIGGAIGRGIDGAIEGGAGGEDNPTKKLMASIRHAGAIFIGSHTPEAIGDYTAGINHILPTGGTARFASSLGVADFMKRTNWLRCDSRALANLTTPAEVLANAEGLDGHALSLSLRHNKPPPKKLPKDTADG